MGCDIHLYSETKQNGIWVADMAHKKTIPTAEEYEDGDRVDMPTSYNLGRNYGLFGLLSEGVRYDTEYAFTRRGLPSDVSQDINELSVAWDGDGHSHNWITVQELKEKMAQFLIEPHEDAPHLHQLLQKLIQDLPKVENPNPEEQRIVFWFDN